MTDDYGLSEMREEHRPRRMFQTSVHRVLELVDGAFYWMVPCVPRESIPWIYCHPDDARLSIEAAMRKALLDAGYEVKFWPDNDRVGTTQGNVYIQHKDDNDSYSGDEYDDLLAAYAAVFPKEAKRG